MPGIIRWPGTTTPGSVSDVPVIGSDFFPTVLSLAGIEPPAGRTLDGVNLLPAMACAAAGSTPVAIDRPEPLYWRWGGQMAYREGPWKIVADEAFTKPELYNLTTDLAESTDLASRDPERLAAMLGRLRAHAEEVEREGPDWWRTEGWNGRKPPRKAAAVSP